MKFHWIIFLLFFHTALWGNVEPRTIIALRESTLSYNLIHHTFEMPLNYLGLTLEYYSTDDPVPEIGNRDDVRGILLWLYQEIPVQKQLEIVEWLEKAVQSKKKFILIDFSVTSPDLQQRVWKLLGLKTTGEWIDPTYNVVLSHSDPYLTGFERVLKGPLPPFEYITVVDPAVVTHLSASWQKNGEQHTATLIATGPNGGYLSSEYGMRSNYELFDWQQWYANPFRLLELAFGVDYLPRPDPTTLAGRRVYFSHIDGDGWNNSVEVEGKVFFCPELVLERCIRAHPNLPVTVAPIEAEIDLDWVGTEKSREMVIQMIKEPQVELGCHTFTHPFDWEFFEKNYSLKKEEPYFHLYPQKGTNKPIYERASSQIDTSFNLYFENLVHSKHFLPRAYGKTAFNLNQEVTTAVEKINELTAPNRFVKIMQWSGDAVVPGKAIELSDNLHLQNINGGGSRFDSLYNSYSWVFPFTRQPEGKIQVYAANKNEYDYAASEDDPSITWAHVPYVFAVLPQTFKRTESPKRIKPMNLYYHFFSVGLQGGLNSILHNFDYIEKQEIAPVKTSHYASMVHGFYFTQLEQVDKNRWKIQNRGSLQTIRFDYATTLAVDLQQSKGVIGQRHYQGSLYVYLDAGEKTPLIVLRENLDYFEEPVVKNENYYLLSSRWPIWNVQKKSDHSFSMQTQGFGDGEMLWRVDADNATYSIDATGRGMEPFFHEMKSQNGLLHFTIPATHNLVTLQIKKK